MDSVLKDGRELGGLKLGCSARGLLCGPLNSSTCASCGRVLSERLSAGGAPALRSLPVLLLRKKAPGDLVPPLSAHSVLKTVVKPD